MTSKKIRYAVVGLGWIAQESILPAFANAGKNSVLTALVSDDPVKLHELAKMYRVPFLYSYNEYQECLHSGLIDAVYIALPNNMHSIFSIEAAKAGIHVLCEKPMAVTEQECYQMIQAADKNDVKLMIAYRLHFEESNLNAIELIRERKLGEVRIFNSLFTMPVKENNIRLERELGGGTLYDIGIYCINASRYLFRDEPVAVTAFSVKNGNKKFKEVDEMTGALLRFPENRLATFVSSFGAYSTAYYEVIGTTGRLRVDQAYHHNTGSVQTIEIDGNKEEKDFPKQDQFAAELLYFSQCVLENKEPEPSGKEGWIDVHIIRSLYQSAQRGTAVKLNSFPKRRRPSKRQMIKRPAVKEPPLVHAQGPKG